MIAELTQRASGRIIVMPGGGIGPDNVTQVVSKTGAQEIHFAALEPDESPMRFRRDGVPMGAGAPPSEYSRLVTSVATIRATMARGRAA